MRCNGLTARERRTLILIDGVKNVHALEQIFPARDLADILSALIRRGLIEDCSIEPAAEPPAAADAAPIHRRPREDAEIRRIKDFMTVTAQTYLGLLGAEVIRHVELASDAAELLAAAGHWHMALHGSKQGSRYAAPYLEQVKSALMSAEAA